MRLALMILLSSLVSGPILLAQSTLTHPIRFEDIAAKAGVHFTTENSPTPEKHQPETMLAGVALFDYDGDGLLDIYLVNGAEMPSLVKTGPKYSNRLFHNNGDGTFTDVTERAGVAGAGYGMGVAVGDLRQRRMARPVSGKRQWRPASSQQWERYVHGRYCEGGIRRRHPQWPEDVVNCGGLVRLQQ